MVVWILMLITDLIIPIIMVGTGKYWIKKPPKSINILFGYRTAMSMKNMDTWNFAHRHIAKTWWLVGLIMLAVTCAAFLVILLLGKDAEFVAVFGGWLCAVQLVPLICSIIPTERALKKNFDLNGNRVKKD